jgi:hypothetical protein
VDRTTLVVGAAEAVVAVVVVLGFAAGSWDMASDSHGLIDL